MSTHKYIDLLCVAVLVCTVLLTVLFMNGERLGIEPIVDGDAESGSASAYFTRNDRDGGWKSADATVISLAGDHARVSGSGAFTYDGNVVIAQAGRYLVSGTLDDGSIVVDADNRAKVWIMLDGADISCSDDACLRVAQADKVFLTLAEGSENSMSSGEAFSEEALADKRNGVISSHDDLTVNGSGSLSLRAAWKHGVDVNDELVITGGTLYIDAPGDALHVNDGLRLENTALSLKAGDEGIHLQSAESLLYIGSGNLEIESAGAGVRCGGNMLLEGGSLSIRAEGDGLHLADSFTMADGALRIASGDDGIHADRAVCVAGGSITVSECYEGIEAPTIELSGGDVSLYPSDDGLNANGGSDAFGPPGMSGAQSQSAAGGESLIRISGGTLTVVNNVARDADGLDSNGDILISGGRIFISLSSVGSNSAIDYGSESGGVCEISGGEVVACGSAMMAEGFSDGSAQCSILYNFSYNVQADTEVSLEDSEGRVLLRYTPPCTFSSVSLSSPEMKPGETYTLVIGDREEQITLEETSASYGDVRGGGFGQVRSQGGAFPGQPGMPDGRPRPSDMPRPPEDFGGGRPAFSGDRPGFSATPTDAGEEAPADTEALPAGPQPVSEDTWFMLSACFLVLFLGLLFAIRYRR